MPNMNALKKCLSFDDDEMKSLTAVALILGFIASFRYWGVDEFSFQTGLNNFVSSVLIVGLAVIAHLFVQRYIALKKGYRVDYKRWNIGLAIGLILAFLSNGFVMFLAIGGIVIHQVRKKRVGLFRGGVRYDDLAIISFFGPLTNILLAILFKTLVFLPNTALVDKLVMINIWIALFAMLPIPPMVGVNIFYISRPLYLTAVIMFVIIAALLQATAVLTAIIGSIFVLGLFLLLLNIIIAMGKWN